MWEELLIFISELTWLVDGLTHLQSHSSMVAVLSTLPLRLMGRSPYQVLSSLLPPPPPPPYMFLTANTTQHQ